MQAILLYALFFLSGTTALVYELVWVRQLVLVFGGTTYAITTVLVAFMAGLGLGSWLAGRWCHRLEQPARVFGYLELGIGLYALAVPFLLSLALPLYRGLYPATHDWPLLLTAVRFCIGGVIVLIPATLMGATLPVLVRHVTATGQRLGQSVGYLYGVNTFGAVLGVMLAGFLLLPLLGLVNTTRLAAMVDVLVGVAALSFLRGNLPPATRTAATARRQLAWSRLSGLQRAALIGFAISGFSAMVYQITWTRALIMSVGSSTYSFTCILAAFILGLALGSLVIARWVDRWRQPVLAIGVIQLLIGLTAVIIVPIHGEVPNIVRNMVAASEGNYTQLVAWQFLLVIAITFVPTLLMGMIFPLVIRALATEQTDAGAATGTAYLANTVGTILGSFLAGFVLIRSEVLGVQNAIIFASLLNGVVGLALVWLSRADAAVPLVRRIGAPLGVLALMIVVALGSGGWDRQLLNSAPYLPGANRAAEQELIWYREGVDLTVGVTQNPSFEHLRSLTVNGKPDASTTPTDLIAFTLLGHVPALMTGSDRSACVIGLGAGLTLSSVSRYPSYERIDTIEISAEVMQAATFFAPYTYNVVADDPRVNVIRADGRNHLLLTDRTYDLILSQPSNPWLVGVSNLFTREFFELGKARLNPDGLFMAWTHSYWMDERDFRMIVRTMCAVFPEVSLWEISPGDFLLLGAHQPTALSYDTLVERFNTPTVRADLYRLGIYRPAQILGRYVMSGAALRRYAGDAPVHTDNSAQLEFSAPQHLYVPADTSIEHTLRSLQAPDTLALFAPGQGPPPEVQSETRAIVRARVLRDQAADAWTAGNIMAGWSALLHSYDANPDSLATYALYLGSTDLLARSAPQVEANPQLAPIYARLRTQPPLVAHPLGNETLAQLAARRRQRAQQAFADQDWERAARELHEAHTLEPDNLLTTRGLAEALVLAGDDAGADAVIEDLLQRDPTSGVGNFLRAAQAAKRGNMDAALAALEIAAQSGIFTADGLRDDDRLAPLRNDPRFDALLRRAFSGPSEKTP